MIIRDNYFLKRSELFTLTPRQEITVDLSLEKVPIKPCTLLVGSVAGRCGRIKGATVKIFNKCFQPIAHTLTDEKGCFYFKNALPVGEYFVIATAEGCFVSEACKVMLYPNKPCSICIWLDTSAAALHNSVYGSVFDENNSKLKNVSIILSNENIKRCVAITQTNADGDYFIYGLKAGKYRISASKEGYFLPHMPSFVLLKKDFVRLNLFLYADPNAYNLFT